MGEWLDEQDDWNDNRGAWNQFVTQFNANFTDSQRDQRVRIQLEVLKMKWPYIDQYTMDFERLLREVGYRSGSAECV